MQPLPLLSEDYVIRTWYIYRMLHINDYQKMDAILNDLNDHYSEIPLGADILKKRSKLDIQENIYVLMLNQMFRDNYVHRHPDSNSYGIKQEGVFFLAEGGYVEKHLEEQEIKQRNKDQVDSVISTNKVSKVSSVITVLAICFSTFLQMNSCRRDKIRDARDIDKAKSDSLQQVLQNQRVKELDKQYNLIMNRLVDSLKTK